MPVIYEPAGRAKEYSDLAANLFTGCPHRCSYCFAPDMLRKDREEFHSIVKPRNHVLEILEKDAIKFEKLAKVSETKIPPILLCFTCDPYPPDERNWEVTRRAIGILHAHGLNFTVLTKSGELAQRDFDLYGPGDTFGTTLTLTSVAGTTQYEPNASAPFQRIENLKIAHGMGICTFVSCEPVIFPEATLKLIEQSAPYVDIFKIGKLNHQEPPEPIDWKKFALDAIELCEKLHKSFVIKKDLAKYLTTEVK